MSLNPNDYLSRPVDTGGHSCRDPKLLNDLAEKKYAVKWPSFGVVVAGEPVYSVGAPTSVDILQKNRVLSAVIVIINELAYSVPNGVHAPRIPFDIQRDAPPLTNLKGTAVA